MRLFGGVARDIGYGQGARPDERHVAFEDIDQLGEFVEGGAAQKASEPRQALHVRPGAGAHRAEFEDGEWTALEAGAHLAEQDGTSVREQ